MKEKERLKMGVIKLKRAYTDLSNEQGYRVLVDRLWPRGIKKETLALDLWEKELAPTNALRHEFNHIPEKYEWFKKEYRQELKNNPALPAFIKQVQSWLETADVILIYGAKDEVHNQAVVLKECLEEMFEK